jgi:CRP/FNR family cyclic AMP-dependent transcriptional regulator
MLTARATMASTVLVVPKRQMIRLLRSQHAFSDRFIAHMLGRNARLEADLVDHLFNSSEKRLARTLLLLARMARRACRYECCRESLTKHSPTWSGRRGPA